MMHQNLWAAAPTALATVLVDGVNELLRHFAPVEPRVEVMNHVVAVVERLLVVRMCHAVVREGVVILWLCWVHKDVLTPAGGHTLRVGVRGWIHIQPNSLQLAAM